MKIKFVAILLSFLVVGCVGVDVCKKDPYATSCSLADSKGNDTSSNE